ncbi:GIN domain-containing protein [Tenacibaculum sp. M341]|uniref:GIN domain-containing protein n=1 Tax=Tenacibaculum sp. M341 TaxID=2530339 RepID=UPI00104DFA22|nr:DUF2807 domain-containing protein [Tenacibaculum sp. M341]TCI90743.1 hypothetical protein EYW44_13560 [Tenacibaculum sp. M341]
MNTKITFFFFSLLLSVYIYCQEKIKGNGVLSIKKTPLTYFSKVEVGNNFEITLIKSSESAIEIETDENIHEHLNTSVSDSILVLKTSKKIRPKKGLKITLFFTDNLKEIVLSDNAKLETINAINIDELNLFMNDYAKVNLHVKSNKFTLTNNTIRAIQLNAKAKLKIESAYAGFNLSNATSTNVSIKSDSIAVSLINKASLKINGITKALSVTAEKNTGFKGIDLEASKTFVKASGNSQCILNCKNDITIDASEESILELYGIPKITVNRFTNNAKLLKREVEE